MLIQPRYFRRYCALFGDFDCLGALTRARHLAHTMPCMKPALARHDDAARCRGRHNADDLHAINISRKLFGSHADMR